MLKIAPLFKGLTWLIGLNILIKPVWIFGIDRKVQNLVGYEAYGSYFALFNLCYLLSFIADAGLTNMVNRNLASGEKLPFRQLLLFKTGLSILYIIAVLLIANISGINNWQLLFYLIAVQILTSFFIFFRNVITALQLFSTDAWLSVIDKFLMIIICGTFLYTPLLSSSFDLILFLQIQTITILLSVMVAAFIVFKKKMINAESFSLNASLKLIMPFTLILLLMSSHTRLDGFLLERLHSDGAYEAGVYASAFRLLDAGNMIGFLAASFLVPFAAKNKNNKSLVSSSAISIRHVLVISAIFITAFVYFFAGWLQQLLYHSQIPYHSQIFVLCILSLPAYYIIHIYSSILTAFGNLKSLIIIVALSVLINSVINIFFIPQYGALASCVAAISSQYICALLCYLWAKKSLQNHFHFRSVVFYLFAAIILCLIFYFGRTTGTNEVFLFFAGGMIAAIIMFALIKKEAFIFIK
jgi:O-antigen/teichoic acid export membrane protein